jgi:hypothetical protein
MSHYYFDTRDNDKFVLDEIGVEIATLAKVKRAASEAMADFAKDVLPGSVVRTLSIEVRDGSGPVLRVVLRFEIAPPFIEITTVHRLFSQAPTSGCGPCATSEAIRTLGRS